MALTSMLIISAIALGIAVSVSLLGVDEVKSSADFKNGQLALLVSKSCVEEALFRLKDDSSYGGGTLNVGNGACNINVSGTGEDRTILVVGQISSVSDYTKQVQVITKLSGDAVNVISWSEIP